MNYKDKTRSHISYRVKEELGWPGVNLPGLNHNRAGSEQSLSEHSVEKMQMIMQLVGHSSTSISMIGPSISLLTSILYLLLNLLGHATQ